MGIVYTELNKFKEATRNIEQFSPIEIVGEEIFQRYIDKGIIPRGDINFDTNLQNCQFDLSSRFDFIFDDESYNELNSEIFKNIGLLIDKDKVETYLAMALFNADIQAKKVKAGLMIDVIKNGKINYRAVDSNSNPIYTDSLSEYLLICDLIYTDYIRLLHNVNNLLKDYIGKGYKEKIDLVPVTKKEILEKAYKFEDLFSKKYKPHHLLFFEALKHPNLVLLSESNVWIGQESDSYTYYKILLQKDIIQEKNVAQAARMFAAKFGVNKHNFQHGSKSKPSIEKLELFATTIEMVISDIHLLR